MNTINFIIIFFIIILFYIDYYHKQYRIKRSKKNIKYRNSHSFYDDTDYSRYKPYKEIYTYKIAAAVLFIAFIINLILYNNTIFLKIIISSIMNLFIKDNWIEIAIIIIISIIIFFYSNKNINKKHNLSVIIIYLIMFFVLLTLSDIVYH